MSRITILLDSLTDVKLKQFCEKTASTRHDAIRALIHVTLDNPYTSRRVKTYLHSPQPAAPVSQPDASGGITKPRPAAPEMRKAITVDLRSPTEVDLERWCGEVDAAEAIEAMVRVMLRDKSIGEKVRKRLVPGPVNLKAVKKQEPVNLKAVKKRETDGFSPV